VFGISLAAKISAVFMIGAFALIIPLVIMQILDWYLIVLSSLLLCSISIAYLMIHTQTNNKYENTSAWTLMYSTYFLFALGFAMLIISFA
jgi:hypothetical protein